jgi:hypothetical protein
MSKFILAISCITGNLAALFIALSIAIGSIAQNKRWNYFNDLYDRVSELAVISNKDLFILGMLRALKDFLFYPLTLSFVMIFSNPESANIYILLAYSLICSASYVMIIVLSLPMFNKRIFDSPFLLAKCCHITFALCAASLGLSAYDWYGDFGGFKGSFYGFEVNLSTQATNYVIGALLLFSCTGCLYSWAFLLQLFTNSRKVTANMEMASSKKEKTRSEQDAGAVENAVVEIDIKEKAHMLLKVVNKILRFKNLFIIEYDQAQIP